MYKPVGVKTKDLEYIELRADEIEALHLHDGQGLSYLEVADHMGVSQPTITRILQSVYAKIAEGLVQGKALRILEAPQR